MAYWDKTQLYRVVLSISWSRYRRDLTAEFVMEVEAVNSDTAVALVTEHFRNVTTGGEIILVDSEMLPPDE